MKIAISFCLAAGLAWMLYNYVIVAPRIVDEYVDAGAAEMTRRFGVGGNAEPAQAEACVGASLIETLPSLYGFTVKARLALREATFGLIGDENRDSFFLAAVRSDFVGSEKTATLLAEEALKRAMEKCSRTPEE